MIFLDTNYFLRFWTEDDVPENAARQAIAAALFSEIDVGAIEATTTEAVLVEVAYVLTSKRQYDLPASAAASYLAEAVRMPGLRLAPGKKEQYLRALELWRERPTLGFVDALTAIVVEDAGHLLATFDSDFDVLPGITFWRPGTNGHGDLVASEEP